MGGWIMSKDDQYIIKNPVDPLEEEYSQYAEDDRAESETAAISGASDSDITPNLDEIRSAGL